MSAWVIGDERLSIDLRRVMAAVFTVIALIGLDRLTEGRMAPLWLDSGRTAGVLHFFHVIGQSLAIFLALLLVASLQNLNGLRDTLLPPRWWGMALIAFVLCTYWLFQRYALLPEFLPLGGLNTARLMDYAIANAVFILWQLLAVLVFAPPGLRQVGGPELLATLGLGIGVTALVIDVHPLALLTESAFMSWTVELSIRLYPLFGSITPVVTYQHVPVISGGGFSILIWPVCAGSQGVLAASSMTLGVIAMLWRRLRVRRALALAAAGVAAVFLLNALRVALLFHIGVEYSPEIAVNGFHSQFGSLSLLGVVATVFLLLQLRFFRRPAAPGEESARPGFLGLRLSEKDREEAVRQMAPLAVLMLTGMIGGLFSDGFNWLYPLSTLVGCVLLYLYRERLGTLMRRRLRPRALMTGVGVFVVWIVLIPPDPAASAAFSESLARMAPPLMAGWIAMRLVGASVIVPVFEELAFRGGLMQLVRGSTQSILGRAHAGTLALLVSTVAFALLHGHLLAAGVAGLAYGLLVLREARLGDAIVAHAVTNFLISIHVLAFGSWSYW